jgi:tRNA U34 2-thiouridine synthase MnmA/TrmU
MLKKAKEFADKNKIEIIATGEVLGERPMSQNLAALYLIEKESGLQGRVLRPLSAKLLEPTKAEREGIINRSKLLDIKGRSRRVQISLANQFKITYPSPAGGCLLCEKAFCEKLAPLLKKKLTEFDIELLKFGRHFEKSNIVLGRNEKENSQLKNLFQKYKEGYFIEPQAPGPSALVRSKKYIAKAKKLIQNYTKHEIKKFAILKN